jgi:flagellar protein FlaG
LDIVNNQSGQDFAGRLSTDKNLAVTIDGKETKQNNASDRSGISSSPLSQPEQDSKSVGGRGEIAKAPREDADNERETGNKLALENALRDVESFVQMQNRNLTFTIDEETKKSVVTVKDSASGDVIRQIPSEEVLKLAERIQSLQEDVGSSVGVFINNQV